MNNKALTMSLVMAVMAVFFVQSYVQSIEDEARKKFGTEVLVLKASRDIKEQETLNEKMLEHATIPKKFVEPAAIFFEGEQTEDNEKNANKAIKTLVGTVAMVPLRKGEQITFNKLTEPSIRTGLAPQVAPGRRAYTINVTEVSGVGRLVKPGDRVDILAVIDMGGGKENKIAKTLLQDVVILATGRNVTNNVPRVVEADPYNGKEKVRSLAEDVSFNVVTLELEPAQAQSLALVAANSENTLTLSLRNNDDSDRVNVGATSVADVLGADAARAQRTPAKR